MLSLLKIVQVYSLSGLCCLSSRQRTLKSTTTINPGQELLSLQAQSKCVALRFESVDLAEKEYITLWNASAGYINSGRSRRPRRSSQLHQYQQWAPEARQRSQMTTSRRCWQSRLGAWRVKTEEAAGVSHSSQSLETLIRKVECLCSKRERGVGLVHSTTHRMFPPEQSTMLFPALPNKAHPCKIELIDRIKY